MANQPKLLSRDFCIGSGLRLPENLPADAKIARAVFFFATVLGNNEWRLVAQESSRGFPVVLRYWVSLFHAVSQLGLDLLVHCPVRFPR